MKYHKLLLSGMFLTVGSVALLATGCGDGGALDENALAQPVAESLDESLTEGTAESIPVAPPVEPAAVTERIRELEAQLAAVQVPKPKPAPAAPRVARAAAPVAQLAVAPPVPPEPTFRTRLVTLPASTGLEVEFSDALSSESAFVGDPVRVVVFHDVVRDGLVAIPAGSELLGTVSDVVAQKKIGGQARLAVDFDRLLLPDGKTVAIQAYHSAEGKRQAKKDAATIGGSAAGGAVLGRVLGKNRDKGTAIGAVVGAAVGTAIARRNEGDPVVIEPGTLAEVTLSSPVEVAVRVPVSPSTALARN